VSTGSLKDIFWVGDAESRSGANVGCGWYDGGEESEGNCWPAGCPIGLGTVPAAVSPGRRTTIATATSPMPITIMATSA
jgi:hypothetical protein